LLKTNKGAYFAVRRFDRTPQGKVHIHTASGLLDADHRTPQLDYGNLLRLTRVLTRDERDVRQMFRRMVFNVLAHNRDDHSKNHAFRMEADGAWHPAPAYDLTLSNGAAGEHSLAVAGEGRNPDHDHIMVVAKDASIPKAEAESVFEEVRAAVARWTESASAATLSEQRISEIDGLINKRYRRATNRRIEVNAMAGKVSKKPVKVVKKAAAKRVAAKPVLLSGGNPQIAKGHGDAPVQAYIAAMPGWKSDVGRRLDAIITRTVPNVRKAVKWNSPFYGVEDQVWFLSFHVFAKYIKVAFFRGASLRPLPPGESKQKHVRYLDIHADDPFDEVQFVAWVKQASQLPGERM
jgi:hypothetical protein